METEDDEDDMHMCLVCHTTIKGIINYVTHKKTECIGKKGNKGEVQQPLHTLSSATGGNVSYIPQKYPGNQQYNTDFAEFTGTTSSHTNLIDFETGQFNSQHVDGVNKNSNLDTVLYAGTHAQHVDGVNKNSSLDTVLYAGHVKTGTLYDQPVAGKTMNIVSTQSSLDIPVAVPLNLSPSLFRSEHSSLSVNTSVSSGIPEDHGLLAGCINSEHLVSEFNTSIAYPVLSSSTAQSGHDPSIIISDIIADNVNKEEDNQNRNISEKVEDFFQSLELMSKNDPRAGKGAGFGQPLSNLPISNILSNLTFSSDEEEFSFDFADDVSFDSLSDDSDVGQNITNRTQTLQSSSLKNRPKFRGKWPPGQCPTTNTPKQSQRPTKGGKKFPPETFQTKGKSQGKLKQHSQIKAFTCSICDVAFDCRFKYSNHFGSIQHKTCLINRRNASDTRKPYKSGRGKSFKLIREVNKQYENDPFSQPFTSDKVESSEKEDTNIDKKDVIIENEEDSNLHIGSSADDDKHVEKQHLCVTESCLEDDGSQPLEEDSENGTVSVSATGDEDIVDRTKQAGTFEKASEDNTIKDDENDSEPMYRAMPLHICTICDRKYPNKYYLSRHLITMFHRNRALSQPHEAFNLLQQYHKYIIRLSPYQCAICRFYFINYKEFLKHLKSPDHVETQENLVAEIMCSLCKYRTHYNDELLHHFKTEEHLTNVRKREKICIIKESHINCKCKYCGLEMNSYTRMKRHNLLKHQDKEFVEGVMKKQIGVRNMFKCSLCLHEFAAKGALGLHIRRRHTQERPYSCDICHKQFTDKHAFNSHQRTSRHLKKVLTDKECTEEREAILILKQEGPSKLNISVDDSQHTGVESRVKNEDKTAEIESCQLINETESFADFNETKEHNSKPLDAVYDLLQIEKSPKNDEKNIKKSYSNTDQYLHSEKQQIKGKKVGMIKVNMRPKMDGRGRKRVVPVGMKDKTYKCNHCSFTVTAYNDLRPHYLKEHAAQTTICELCDIVFLSDKAMKLHILSKEHQENINSNGNKGANDVKYFECHICKKKFTDEKYCNFHTAYQHFHITTEEGIIKEYGEKDSITRVKFKQVLAEIEHLPHVARIECPECKVKFKKPNFLEHLRIHTGEKPFKCKMCPRAFMANVTLRKHLLGHFGCQERTCEICNKHFKKVGSYTDHMQVHSAQNASSEKMHVCDTCGLSFYLARQLQTHVRRHKEKEFKCTVPGCHWKFLFANELKYHMRSHSQQKPFLCDICGYSASSKCRLSRHHRTHTGERNYHCEYCSYKAGNRTHLHRHMRIHIGSKPFQCPYCEYACNTHENMRKHIIQTKKHVGLKIYPCKFCDFGTNSCADFRNHLMENHEKELGPNINLMNGLSKFTGLYRKDLDPKQPIEGNKIHQVKERTPKVKKVPKEVPASFGKKEKSNSKTIKMVKQSSGHPVLFMDLQDVTDVSTVLDESEIGATVKENNTDVLMELKSRADGNQTKPIDATRKPANHVAADSLPKFQVVSKYEEHRSYTKPKMKTLVEKLESNNIHIDRHSSPQNDEIQSQTDELYEEAAVRNLGFSHGYVIHTPTTTHKQNLTHMNTPLNYRSLLKGNTMVNIPGIYQTYNSYSDQQLHGNSSHEYSGGFSGNHVPLYHGNRLEGVDAMMADNQHRINDTSVPYSDFVSKRFKSNEEEREQPGNLIIDLGFDKKHC